jgi:hypothetical protein
MSTQLRRASSGAPVMLRAEMTPSTIWKRRVALMAIVGVVIAIPLTLLLRGGDDDNRAPAGTQVTTPLPEPELGDAKSDQGLDVDYRIPDGWSQAKKESAIRLASDDHAVQIVIAAPADASQASGVLDQTLASIRDGYDDVKISRGSGKKVGGLEAKGAVVRASTGDVGLRILVATAAGDERAYLVEVFTAADVGPADLRSAQAALNSLKLKG